MLREEALTPKILLFPRQLELYSHCTGHSEDSNNFEQKVILEVILSVPTESAAY